MEVTAWKGGNGIKTKPAGYGLKVKIDDRDRYFDTNWKTVFIHLEGIVNPIEINIDKPSFWTNTCHELISRDIGSWLLENGFAPWPKYQPPKFELIQTKDNHFKIVQCSRSV